MHRLVRLQNGQVSSSIFLAWKRLTCRVYKILPIASGSARSDCSDSCHGEAVCLVIGFALDPINPLRFAILSVRTGETFAIGNHR
jgi:hypothetical protein